MIDEKIFEWDDVIENDSPEFIILPEGDYDFEVTNFERTRYSPGPNAKLPECPQAILHITIRSPQGITTIKHNLFLHSRCEGMLCAFFTAIGQRKPGEKLKMNWGTVIGSTGRCKVGVRNWKKDGEDRQSNEIKKFYEPTAGTSSRAPGTSYTPGAF